MHKHRADKVIIVAAGVGERLKPITDTTPKPLLRVKGIAMIESTIDAFIQNGIKDFYVVVGHLKEQFGYLPRKYKNVKINLLDNPYYATCNNISSLYIARKHLGNCIITDGDMLIHNPEIFDPRFDASGYCSAWAERTNEWLQQLDDEGYVASCSRTGGEKGWQLFSVSFWNETDGKRLAGHVEDIFKGQGVKDIYWDDVPMFLRKDEYRLKIREIRHEDLTEIDSIDELIAADDSYKDPHFTSQKGQRK